MKTALITGATDGIGLQTAAELASRSYRIIVMGRSQERCEAAVDKIKEARRGDAGIYSLCADLSDRAQIKQAGMFLNNYIKKIDMVINNAGTFERQFSVVEGSYEKTFFVNHLAPFYLTWLVMDILLCSTAARIINVSSMAHAAELPLEHVNDPQYFDPYSAYAWSKLANILFTFRLSKLLKDKNISVNCLHPGVINTKLLRAGWGTMGDELKKGAATSVFLATEAPQEVSGRYFVNKQEQRPHQAAYDEKLQDALWQYSEEVFGIRYADKLKK